MYSSDLTEAFVRAHQHDLLERAAADRQARAVTRPPAAPAPRRHRLWPHPLIAFHTWLAAGQL